MAPTSNPATDTPTDAPGGGTDPAVPEDFGAAVLAEMSRREASATPSVATPDEVANDEVDYFGLKEWPGGTSVDAGIKPAEAPAETAEAPVAEDAPTDQPGTPSDAAVPPGDSESSTDRPAVEEGSDDAAGGTAPAASSGYIWNEGEHSAEFDDEQVREGLVLSAWARRLPDETREQFAAIEQGRALAISREEYTQFAAWRDQQSRSTRDADLTQLDVEPEIATIISGLRDEVAQLRGQASATAPQVAAATENVNGNLDATLAAMDRAGEAYAQQHALTDAEYNHLYDAAVRAGTVPHLAQQLAQFNPVTGALIAPADPGVVLQRALDLALASNPQLLSSVQARIAQPAAPSTSDTSTEQPAPDALAAKKARASSVSSAPSAVVTPSPRSLVPSSPEMVAAMAKDIAAVLGHD